MNIDRDEFEWWCNEYPELDREEILYVLEAVDGEEINNKKELIEACQDGHDGAEELSKSSASGASSNSTKMEPRCRGTLSRLLNNMVGQVRTLVGIKTQVGRL